MRDFMDIRGWMEPQNRAALHDWSVLTQARRVLEIGVYAGRTTVALAEALRSTGGVLHAVDSYTQMGAGEGAGIAAECLRNLTAAGLRDVVRLHVCTSAALREVWAPWNTLDLVWVDGDHYSADSVSADLAWEPYCRRLAGHDWHIPTVRDTVAAFAMRLGRKVICPPGMVNCWEILP